LHIAPPGNFTAMNDATGFFPATFDAVFCGISLRQSVGVNKQGYDGRRLDQFVQQLQSRRRDFGAQLGHARDVAAAS
jgi:hypothetical protein